MVKMLWKSLCLLSARRLVLSEVTCVCTRSLSDNSLKDTTSLADKFRQAAEAQPGSGQVKLSLCRTSESDPAKHNRNHLGLFYTVPKNVTDRWLHNVFRPEYYKQVKAFHEMCIMVREPALEIMDYLNMADYNLPVVRYLLYGRTGSGKSLQLGHILHYCATQGWLIAHVRWAATWNWHMNEIQPSTYKDRFDLPIHGATWLAYFKLLNEPMLKSLDLRSENRYVWNKRESIEVGDPWMQAIEFALARPKYACDVVGMIIKEMKIAASKGKVKPLIAVEGVNAFWEHSRYKVHSTDTETVHASKFSLQHNFKKLIKNDWSGGAIVLTADEEAAPRDQRGSFLPKYLLKTEGFEHLDPHIPVHVPHYNDKEFHSCLTYYLDRKWIQNPHGDTESGKKELVFLSSRNPREFYDVTRIW